METEYEVQSTLVGASAEKTVEIADGCEEILLPAVASITNGAAGDIGVTGVEYLEEENDPMEEVNSDEQKAGKSNEEENEVDAEEVVEELEEEIDDECDEPDEGEEVPAERKPTQVPKKRRDAALLAAATEGMEEDEGEEEEDGERVNNIEEDEEGNTEAAEPKEEKPTSSARAAANKENSVDEEQCRVCTTKEDLVSLFKKVEKLTVAELLMTICPTVSIARKDFMPQYICNSCLDNVTIAVQLKTQCETTERELRKKLSRSKNKVRRPAGYVVIDAHVESDPPSEEELNDDVEFKVSDAEISLSADDDSEDSDFSSKKKRPGRGAGSKRGRRKSAAVTPTPKPKPKPKEKKRVGRPPTKRPTATVVAASSDEEKVGRSYAKKKRASVASGRQSPDKPTEYPCDECEQVFTRKLSLVLHRKVHSGTRELINCKICGKQFKILGAYRTHLEKHKDDLPAFNCEKCDSAFTNKADLRRHLADEHGEHGMVYLCNKCKRTFVTEARLIRHRDGRCPGYEPKQKKNEYEGFTVGKDLFKSVAPLTTTYWSDSFSD